MEYTEDFIKKIVQMGTLGYPLSKIIMQGKFIGKGKVMNMQCKINLMTSNPAFYQAYEV